MKIPICVLILLFSGDMLARAAGSSGYRGAGHGGSRSGYTGGGKAYHRSGGSSYRGGHSIGHGHYRHHGRHWDGSSYRILIGPGRRPGWLGPAYPYYRYRSYSYFSCYPRPVVIFAEPQLPEAGQEQENYWYYCQDPPGFYPYVKSCPGGWMKVVPEPNPPESR